MSARRRRQLAVVGAAAMVFPILAAGWTLLREEALVRVPRPPAPADRLPRRQADTGERALRTVLEPAPVPRPPTLSEIWESFRGLAEPDVRAHLAFLSGVVQSLDSPAAVDCSREKSELTYVVDSGKVVVHREARGIILEVSSDQGSVMGGISLQLMLAREGAAVTGAQGDAGGERNAPSETAVDVRYQRGYRVTRAGIKITGERITRHANASSDAFPDRFRAAEARVIEPLQDVLGEQDPTELLALAQAIAETVDEHVRRHCRLP